MGVFEERIKHTHDLKALKDEKEVINRILNNYPEDDRELKEKIKTIEKRILQILENNGNNKEGLETARD